jgi:hypothetical protein
MHWEDLAVHWVGDWAADQRRLTDLPPSLSFGPPTVQVATAREILSRRGWGGDVSSPAGTVRMPATAPDDARWADALDYVHSTDLHREVDEQPDLRADEQPSAFVRRQALTAIEGLPSLGPGGRMTLFDLPSGSFVEISVRPRAELVGATGWRDPGDVQAAVTAMVGDVREYRLRGALGYSEPSSYEVARLTRPSYVFVLDGPDVPGAPHWRVSIAVPATVDGDGDDGPAGRGQDSDWCV